MSKLYIIRHAQASLFEADYDQLSKLGATQSVALGQYFAKTDLAFDKVFLGPLKRHQQTADFVGAALSKKGLSWEPEVIPEFSEHQGPEVVRWVVENFWDKSKLPSENRKIADPAKRMEIKRQYFAIFQQISRQWVKGEVDLSTTNFEDWPDFYSRVQQGIQQVLESCKSNQNVAVFTSGGPVAAAVGQSLGLNEERIIELSWVVHNTSITEFIFSKDRFSLKAFNGVPHLDKKELLTLV